jgi:hypothetical protein
VGGTHHRRQIPFQLVMAFAWSGLRTMPSMRPRSARRLLWLRQGLCECGDLLALQTSDLRVQLRQDDAVDDRACALLSVARSTLGYQSRLLVKDGSAARAANGFAQLEGGPGTTSGTE